MASLGPIFKKARRGAATLLHPGRRTSIALAVVGGVVLAAVSVSFLLDEPLRRVVERQMNARLTGYTVSIGQLDFHPAGLSLTLRDLVFRQEAHPDPPVARIPKLDASVQWTALLSARLVADFTIDRPALHVNLEHLRAEARDPQPVTEKGWQAAFQAVYPLKINELQIVDGAVTYVDAGPSEPLELTAVNLTAENIRNVRSRPGEYPSPVRFDAVVFGSGTVAVDGHADFLAEPHPAIKAVATLDDIDLDRFKPVANRYHVAVHNGVLTAKGMVEYAPSVKIVDLETATIRNVQVEYTHLPANAGAVKKAVAETAEKAREVSDEPGLVLHAREVKVVDSTVGFVDRAARVPYRVFLADTNLTITDFSNHRAEGPARVTLNGRFMGSGNTVVTAAFRPDKAGPDFDLKAKVENTDLRALNDLLRSYGRFDVNAGRLSVYSEIAVKSQRVEGYVKPLFSGLDVYDPEQDRDKGMVRKLYEKAVEGASKLLKNEPREEVATVAPVSGPIEDPAANTLEVLAKLLQNAFFKAILPGFDREVRGLRHRS